MHSIQLAFNSSFSAHLLWIDIQIRAASVGFVFPEVLLSWSVSYCEFSCTYNTSVKLWKLCHLSHTNSYQLSHKSYTTHVLMSCVLWSSVLSRDVVVFGLFCCAFICFVFCVLSYCCVVLVFVSSCVYVADAPVMSAMLPLRLLW